MSSLRARLFGQFELLQGDAHCNLPAASNARTLLAFLLLHKERAFSRSVLADLIAPDLTETQAHHALSQALWHIRRALPGWLESDASQVSISALVDVKVDALEFEALVGPHLTGRGQPTAALADLRRAIELYRDDLLEGYYDDWVFLERERLRELYLQALEKLVTVFKAALQYQQALATALRLASADPLNESAHREVMRLYHYLGCPGEALRQYETCREILRREFGLEPEAETSQIAQAIAQRSGRAAAPYLPEPLDGSILGEQQFSAIPLIGRSTERARLVDWLRQNQAGGGTLILVEGEAGVGKTRLLQEVAHDIEWHGAQVLWGKAMPLTDSRPLEPLVTALDSGLTPLRVEQLQHLVEPLWLQALEPVLPRVAQNLSGLVPLPMLEDRQAKIRLLEGLIRLLAAWAQINPLVIIIEDVHWADADTMDILAELASRLEKETVPGRLLPAFTDTVPGRLLPAFTDTVPFTVNVSLALSYRREELAGLPEIQAKLSAIRAEAVRGRLALVGLEAVAVHELIHASLGAGETSPAFEEVLHQETHGNPLFILEVLRGLYDEGVLRRNEAGTWITPYDSAMGEVDLPLPPAVEQVIVRRLEQLPVALRDLLEGLAVLGGEFDFEMVACLGLADAPTLVTALQALCRRRLLAEAPRAYRFSHDKIRQVVYDNLSTAQRTAWHQRLAAALEQAHPDQVEALALHYTEGEAWHKACFYQKLAAEKARLALAYANACGHIGQAILAAEQASLPAQERFELLCFREEILDVLGKRQEQGQDLEQMALQVQGDPRRLSEVHRRRAYWLCCLSRFEEAEAAARQALELARQAGDEDAQAAAGFMLGIVIYSFRSGRSNEARDYFITAAEYYHRTQNLKQAAEAHNWLAGLSPSTTQIEEARQALALAQQVGDKALEADLYCGLASIYWERGSDYAMVIQAYQNALEIARTIGYRLVEARALNNLANLYVSQQPDRALSYFDQSVAILWAMGDGRRAAHAQLNAALDRSLLLGDEAASRQAAESVLDYATTYEDNWMHGFALMVMGTAAWRRQDFGTAHRFLEDSISTLGTAGIWYLVAKALIIRAYVELDLGVPEEAIASLKIAESLSSQQGWSPMLVMAQTARVIAHWKLHQLEQAERLSAEALENLSPFVDRPWVTHLTRYQVLTALGRHEEARQPLEAAYQGLEQMLSHLTPEQRAMSCQRVPEHREILAAWQAAQPRRIAVRLARASAPLGRALHDDEWVEVTWTVAALEDDRIPGKVERRRYRLLRLLQEAHNQRAAPTSENLAQALGVSLRTIAGDIAALETENARLIEATLRGRGG